MHAIAMTNSSMPVAIRVRVLKGSIAYLLEELIDTCSEEGVSCNGSNRKQLFSEINELSQYYREYPIEAENQSEASLTLSQIVEKLEGPDISIVQLLQIQRDFHRLIHSVHGA